MKPGFKTFKLDDVKELQDLVAEHVDSVEPGLRLLDTRVLLGSTTIDLLALDARGGLTLLALGFAADDEMLLRALEAYSWCLEYPDALRRLYPTVQLSATEPPRVLFIAERVPDAFLRKIKHLRFQRAADCVEFRFGLQFSVVDGSRGADDQAEPRIQQAEPRNPQAEPRKQAEARNQQAEPRNGHHPKPVRALAKETVKPGPVTSGPNGAEHRDSHETASLPEMVGAPGNGHAARLEGLRLPEDDTRVPQWREVLNRAVGEVDEWKVKAVREYLQREFPTAVIYDFYAHDHSAQMFHLQDSQGSVIHSASVADDLLQECNEAQLRAFLDKHKLARVLRQAGQAGVTVTKVGLKIERR